MGDTLPSPEPASAMPGTATIEAYARATATALGLHLDDAWVPGVVEYLELLFGRAALVAGQRIDDHVEPAPVFVP